MEYNVTKKIEITNTDITKQFIKNIFIHIQNHFHSLNLIGKINIDTASDTSYSYDSLNEFQDNYVHNSKITALSIVFLMPDPINAITHRSLYIRLDKRCCHINVTHTNQALAQNYLEEIYIIMNSYINNDKFSPKLLTNNNSKSQSSNNTVTVTYSKEEREHQSKSSKKITLQNGIIAIISGVVGATIGALLNHFLTK